MPAPTNLSLRPGACHVEHLPGRGPVGYVWLAEVDGAAVEVALGADEAPPGPPVAGAGVPERAEIRAVAPGHAVVRLRQVRPWEGGEQLEERIFDIVVEP